MATRVKTYDYIKRTDISVLKATIDGKVMNVDPKKILSGTYVKGKLKPTASVLRVAKTDPASIREKLLKKYKDFAEEEYNPDFEKYITVAGIKKFVEHGLTEEMIMAFYGGIECVMSIKADNEFAYKPIGGVFNFRTDEDGYYIKNWVERGIFNCENNVYELGFKYPQFNWSSILTKGSGTEVIFTPPYDYFGKERIDASKLEKFTVNSKFTVIAVKSGSYSENGVFSSPSTNAEMRDPNIPLELNGGYLAVVSRNANELFALAKKLLSQPKSYVKDFDWLVQSKTNGAEELNSSNYKFKNGGGIGEEDFIAAAKTSAKSNINWQQELKHYAGDNYSSLTPREREEMIADMQNDWDFHHSYSKGGKIERKYLVLWDDKTKEKLQKKYFKSKEEANVFHKEIANKPNTVLASVDFELWNNGKLEDRKTLHYKDGGGTQVAEIIAQQMGGTGRLRAMTGAYNFGTSGKDLVFKIKNRTVNYIKVTLNGRDLYDMEFGRVRAGKYTIVKEYKDVYFDQLIQLFEKTTGMYLTMSKGGSTYAEGGNIEPIEIDEDGSNLPPQLYELFGELDEDNDPYKEMERLRLKAHKIGYDFDYDLSGRPTEFWKIEKANAGYLTMSKGGNVRTMEKGDAVFYRDETWYVTEKGGQVGIVSMRQGAWGSDYPFVPLTKIIQEDELTDMYGNKVFIPYSFEKANMGALILAEKAKGLAPKSFDSIDTKIANKVAKKSFAERMSETGDPEYDKQAYQPSQFKKGGGLSDAEYIPRDEIIKVELKNGKVIVNTYNNPIYSGVRLGEGTSESEAMEKKGQLRMFAKGGNLPQYATYIPKSQVAKIYVHDEDEPTVISGSKIIGGVWFDNEKAEKLIASARKQGLIK
jgi:hypothetical protein